MLVFTDPNYYGPAKLVLLCPGLFVFSEDDVYRLEGSWNVASDEQAYIDARAVLYLVRNVR